MRLEVYLCCSQLYVSPLSQGIEKQGIINEREKAHNEER